MMFVVVTKSITLKIINSMLTKFGVFLITVLAMLMNFQQKQKLGKLTITGHKPRVF